MYLPSLILWPPLNTGFRAERPSIVVSGRLPSSLSIVIWRSETAPVALSATFMVVVMGTISSA